MSVNVKIISEPLDLGEGPHWDSRVQALYYVNISQNTILKYDPVTGLNNSTKLNGPPGFIVPVEGVLDKFVVGVERKFLLVQWDGEEGSPATVLKELGEVDKDVPFAMRINDGKVDPRGRLLAGTLDEDFKKVRKAGSLYCLEGGEVKRVEQGIVVANGLSWDLDEKAFYYTDSIEHNIRRYDYDVETGDISNLRYIFDFKKNGIEGFPDGHTIDTEGNLWVAVFGGSCVLQIDPRSGKLLRKLPIPALQVTSATFGGPDLDVLYVTSAGLDFSGEQTYPAGCTFMVSGLGVKGHPNRNVKL